MRKENLSYQDKINELRLDFTHPKSKDKVFVLLEGDSDVRLYRKLYNHPHLKIETIAGGKLWLEKSLQELSPLFKHIIGIRDADFLHLENKKLNLPNLFLTDLHDMEMMMVASNQTFSAILYEFCNLSKEEHEITRKKLLESLRFISYFRWYNELNTLEFSFEGVTLGDIFEPKSCVIDNQRCVDKIAQKSKNAKITDIDTIFNHVLALKDDNHDHFQLCNGHDFMQVLALFLNAQNSNGLTAKGISSHFRTAYSFTEFEQSNLHKQVKDWAISQDISIHFNE